MTTYFRWGNLLKAYAQGLVDFETNDYFVFDTEREVLLNPNQTAPGIVSEINTLQPRQSRSSRISDQDTHPITWQLWLEFRKKIEEADNRCQVLWCKHGGRFIHNLQNHWLITPNGVEFQQRGNELQRIERNSRNAGVIPHFGSLKITPIDLRVMEAIAREGANSLSKIIESPQVIRLTIQQIEQSIKILETEGLIESTDPLRLSWDAYRFVEAP